ncbi:MAG: hypothetical protein ACPHKJ_04790 [Litorivicinaceae bacterium]
MKKVINQIFLATLLVALSGCATYNSVAPEWAKIGSETAEVTTEEKATDESGDNSVWWNPLTWF